MLADLDWVADLAASRRARLAAFAPRFWNPSRDARAVHAGFLGGLIGSPDVMALRSEHGFLFGLPRRSRLLVDDLLIDDMVMADEARCPDEGVALLRHAACAADPAALRFVCPVPELPRAAAARALAGLLAAAGYRRTTDYYATPGPRRGQRG
jgi:hypothetical protein